MSDQVEARLVDVVFPFYAGKAGLRIQAGVTELAYQGRPPRIIASAGSIDGQKYVVISARASEMTRGFTVLTVELEA